MKFTEVLRCTAAVTFVLLMAGVAQAQEAGLSGTVTDSTGAVLPGVTVTATHVGSGNVFTVVTDARGDYHFASLRIGEYKISAELDGFAPLARRLELLVGQRATLDLQMDVTAMSESLTVTGEAPLIDTTSSTISGNIDPRQMQSLPLNGRNWLDLSLLTPGSRANSVTEAPLPKDNGAFQLNLDGQEVTSNISASSFGSPHYARDSIAEFQFVSNRFDVSLGRSSGVQVNAVSKSGSNNFTGTFYGYFRNDKFNAPDFVAHKVLPYSDQQIGGTIGGPLIKNKMQFFGYYEGERQPQSFVFTTPYPAFNIAPLKGNQIEQLAGVRVDDQLSQQTRVSVRANKFKNQFPYDPRNTGGGTQHPSAASHTTRYSSQLFANVSQVLSNSTVNEIKGGYTNYWFYSEGVVPSVRINLPGFSIGNPNNYPERFGESRWSIQDSLTTYFDKAGRHEIKAGGEYLHNLVYATWPLNQFGVLQLNGIPPNLASLFPVWNNPSTWNLAPLSPYTSSFKQAFGPDYILDPEHILAAWIQDNWSPTNRLTLNLGIRYDVDLGVFLPEVSIPPFLVPGSPTNSNHDDLNNFGPRTGFTYKLRGDGNTLMRGGYGLFFAQVTNNQAHDTRLYSQIAQVQIFNDGRADFAANPYGAVTPSYELAKTYPQSIQIYAPGVTTPYTHQASIGIEQQLSNDMSVTADYVYTGARKEWYTNNVNLSYNPATGANYPFTDLAHRPYPTWGPVAEFFSGGRSNYHGLQTSWTRRFKNNWQAGATYTLSKMMDDNTSYGGSIDNPFNLAAEYAPSTADQRHRATFNGIWNLPYKFQISGVYFFGSGFHFNNVYGGDLRNTGGFSSGRLRPNGTIVPRDTFVGRPVHRVDMRLSRQFTIVGSLKVDGILEVFNLLNHANYGSYVTSEALSTYGQPQQSTELAYQPRMLQLAFHFVF